MIFCFFHFRAEGKALADLLPKIAETEKPSKRTLASVDRESQQSSVNEESNKNQCTHQTQRSVLYKCCGLGVMNFALIFYGKFITKTIFYL